MLSNQQENLISLLKCKVHCEKSDCVYFSVEKFKIQHNKHLFFIIKKYNNESFLECCKKNKALYMRK